MKKAVFRIKDNLKINTLLNQIPTCFYDIFEGGFGNKILYKNKKKDLRLRKKINLQISNRDEFVRFIDENIREDIPICFIEGFKEILKYTKMIKLNQKLYFHLIITILTSYLKFGVLHY